VSRRIGLALALVACPSAGDGSRASPPSGDGGIGRRFSVGNPAGGIDQQPDYDRDAQDLRARVDDRLPSPLPSPAVACERMLDAAITYYENTEQDASGQVAALRATRADDLAACERETSPAAASCAAIMLADVAGEFPWLLDQCSRAFPREGAQ
jgi:hypothetical protein